MITPRAMMRITVRRAGTSAQTCVPGLQGVSQLELSDKEFVFERNSEVTNSFGKNGKLYIIFLN